jgi:hypothetical protein
MFVHPDRYVHYKWTEMREFFSEYSVYTVRQGFDSGQYRALNDACQTLLDRLEERIPEASMLHVQTLIWSWDDLMGADEHGDETDATASEEDDTATDEDAVAVDALREAAPDDVAFYWVNQTHDEELENGYLRSVDRKWQRDLTVLDPGDVVFHYRRKELRACSVVSKEAYREAYDGEQQYFVDLDTELLVDPLATGRRSGDVDDSGRPPGRGQVSTGQERERDPGVPLSSAVCGRNVPPRRDGGWTSRRWRETTGTSG